MTALNLIGRVLVDSVTNKSGGALAKGDVVIVDTSNDRAVTTTTTGQAEVTVGVVIEENGIANNAVGRVQFGGYVGLVNVPSSMTRGRYLETHTVAKQATGSATRRAGSFGQFATGGTTPTAWLWGSTDQTASGGGGTQGTELDYVASTSTTSLTATTEGTAHTCISGTSQAYAAVPTMIEVFCPRIDCAASGTVVVLLFDGATVIGRIGLFSGANLVHTLHASYRLMPTAATHQYIVKAYSTTTGGAFGGSTGGTGNEVPAFIRATKV